MAWLCFISKHQELCSISGHGGSVGRHSKQCEIKGCFLSSYLVAVHWSPLFSIHQVVGAQHHSLSYTEVAHKLDGPCLYGNTVDCYIFVDIHCTAPKITTTPRIRIGDNQDDIDTSSETQGQIVGRAGNWGKREMMGRGLHHRFHSPKFPACPTIDDIDNDGDNSGERNELLNQGSILAKYTAENWCTHRMRFSTVCSFTFMSEGKKYWKVTLFEKFRLAAAWNWFMFFSGLVISFTHQVNKVCVAQLFC